MSGAISDRLVISTHTITFWGATFLDTKSVFHLTGFQLNLVNLCIMVDLSEIHPLENLVSAVS